MDAFPVISLPEYFTYILRSNMQVSGQNFAKLHAYIESQLPFHSIIKKVFFDFGGRVEIGKVIKSLGWVGFRNRMANAFLQYEQQSYFSDELDSSLVIDLVNMEEDLKSYEVSGYSRGFLLGFYIKMIEIRHKKNNLNHFTFDLSLIPLFELSTSKAQRIDWSYLILMHFNEFLGEQKLKDHLNKRSGFDFIYSELSDQQQSLFSENLLSYGCSIGEADIFHSTQV